MENFDSKEQNEKDFVEVNFVQIIQYLYTYRYIIAIVTLALPSFVALWTFFIQKPVYESYVAVNVHHEKDSDSVSLFRLPAWFEEQEIKSKLLMTKQFFETPFFRLSLLDEVEEITNHIENNDVNKKGKMILRKYFLSGNNAPRSEKAAMLFSRLKLTIDDEYNRIIISARYHNPIISTALVDLTAQYLVAQNYTVLKRRIHSIRGFLNEQTVKVKDNLVDLESKMINLQKKHKIIALGEVKSKINSNFIDKQQESKKTQGELLSTQLTITELKNDLRFLRKELGRSGAKSYLYLTQLQKRLQVLNYQKNVAGQSLNNSDLAQLSSQYTELARDLEKRNQMVEPNMYIKQLEETLVELEKKKHQLESSLKVQRKNFANLDTEFAKLPEALQEIGELKREIEWKGELYANLQKRSQEFSIEEAGLPNDLIILSLAEMPVAPIGMRVSKKLILAMIAGMALSILFFLMYYIVIPTIRNQRDLMNIGIKVIGGLPWCRVDNHGILALSQYPHLVLKESSVSKEANAIRHARFKLEKNIKLPRGKERKRGKVLTTCSVKSEEGKTFITANLGYALSLADYKVLLLDLDLMKPNVHHYFPDVKKDDDTLVESHDNRITFHKHKINNYLDLIDTPVIAENVCDFLETSYFSELLEDLRKEYDLIMIDTPPINGHLESFILAQMSDALLFVANQRKTLRDDLDLAVKGIQEHFNGQSLGILNFIFEELKSSSRNYKKFGFIKAEARDDLKDSSSQKAS